MRGKLLKMKDEHDAVPIIYYNDIGSFRDLPKNKLWHVKYHLKQVIKVLLSSITRKKSQQGFANIDKLIKGKQEGVPFTIITKESYSDCRIHTSRKATLFGEIDEKNPIQIISNKIPNEEKELKFGIFLNKQANHINTIKVEGFVQYSGENKSKNKFVIYLDEKTISGLARPTYWIDIKISTGEMDDTEKPMDLYVAQINIKDKIKSKPFRYNILTEETSIEKSRNNHKQVFILSFDGISTNDLLSNEKFGYLFPQISSFAKDNYWFKNAITSSTVTASSAASLMTGLSLPKHYIYRYDDTHLSPNIISISQRIKTLGQKTHDMGIPSYGLFAFGRWAPQFGFSRGFNSFRSVNSGALQNYPWLEESIKVFSKNRKNSFLFGMHHPGGHPPFSPIITNKTNNSEYAAHIQNLIYVELYFSQIANYLKSNGLYEDSLIVFLSDHGRSLGAEYNRKVFQFTENRLRVPLIVKHPNWKKENTEAYNTEGYISAQTTVHEIVANYLDDDKCEISDYQLRTIDDISWVCETVDYRRDNYIGLVGYDRNFKYTIYYYIDFKGYSLGKSSDLKKYRIDELNINEKGCDITNKREKEKIINSSTNYLNEGLGFSKMNPPELYGNHTVFCN